MKTQPLKSGFSQLFIKLSILVVLLVNLVIFAKLAGLYSCNASKVAGNQQKTPAVPNSPVKLTGQHVNLLWDLARTIHQNITLPR